MTEDVSTYIPRRQPETLRLRAVMPVLSVSNVEKSTAWYRDIMGFVVVDQVHNEQHELVSSQVRAGKIHFLLQRKSSPMGALPAGGVGIGIVCASRQDLALIREELRTRGAEPEEDVVGGGNWPAVSVRDPDGFRLTITAGNPKPGGE